MKKISNYAYVNLSRKEKKFDFGFLFIKFWFGDTWLCMQPVGTYPKFLSCIIIGWWCAILVDLEALLIQKQMQIFAYLEAILEMEYHFRIFSSIFGLNIYDLRTNWDLSGILRPYIDRWRAILEDLQAFVSKNANFYLFKCLLGRG